MAELKTRQTTRSVSVYLHSIEHGKRRSDALELSRMMHQRTCLSRLGKFKTGKSCLYINKLEDVDLDVLQELIGASVRYMRRKAQE